MKRAIALGVFLAWSNVLLVAFVVFRDESVTPRMVDRLNAMLCSALAAGAFLGWLGWVCADVPVRHRRALLGALTLGCAVLIDVMSDVGRLIPPAAAFATVVFVLILERQTRTVPVLPPATAR